ncbi:MAG: response regulator [Nitrospinae bacterium]|nr:response regulator [Nitrospinota bacterium]
MKSNGKVIFIDDEKHVRLAREQTLRLANYEVTSLASAEDALNVLTPEWNGVLVADIKMPGMDGMALLKKAMEIDPDIPVVMVAGHGDEAMAVEAMREGAYDFMEKLCPAEAFLDVVKRAVEKRRLVMEIRELRSRLDSQGESPFHVQRNSPQDPLSRIWDGNVRELKSEVERFVLNRQFQTNLPAEPAADADSQTGVAEPASLSRQVNEFEKVLIEHELMRQRGDIKKTHTALGLPRQTLYDKMNKYGLKRIDYI